MDFGIVLGFLGVLLGFLGIFLTFITFFVPDLVLRFALRRTKDWQRVIGADSNIHTYRNRILSGFSIVIDWNTGFNEGYYETWLDATPALDQQNNRAYPIEVRLNGILIFSENFVSFDGGRYFVPQPRQVLERGRYRWKFDDLQRNLFKIIGSCYSIVAPEELLARIENAWHQGNKPTINSVQELSLRIDEFKKRTHLF